jgi:hypothetical protein
MCGRERKEQADPPPVPARYRHLHQREWYWTAKCEEMEKRYQTAMENYHSTKQEAMRVMVTEMRNLRVTEGCEWEDEMDASACSLVRGHIQDAFVTLLDRGLVPTTCSHASSVAVNTLPKGISRPMSIG